MTGEFDPTRPCRYRNGEEPLAVFVLPHPAEYGETIVSVRKGGGSHTHFPDGKCYRGIDLINIPEEVEVERWGIISKETGQFHNTFGDEKSARELQEHFHVVRMTGKYTR